MRLSEEKIGHLCHLVCNGLYHADLVDYVSDEEALKLIKQIMTRYLQTEDQIDAVVRHKISSLKRGVAEASREWEILYKKFYEEEAGRRRF